MSRPVATLVVALCALLLVAAAAPDDPYYPQQWNLDRIRAPEAWAASEGEGIVVAVVDSGVDLTHPDLAASIARAPDGSVLGWDFVDEDADPTDEHGHGTMVAGLVAARTGNGTAVASVAPRARIMPVRVLDQGAAGTSEDVDAGIRWAVDNGAHVVNLSLEVAEEQPGPVTVDDGTDDAVRYAWERGVAVVAAAGNDSAGFTDYTRDTPVLIVGATDRDDQRAGFSDTGRDDAVMAPGVHIVSTWCDPCGSNARNAVGMSEGTSYAAPQVAGVLALLRATGLGSEEAVLRVRDTAVDVGQPGPDQATGRGRIDAAAALGVGAPASPPPPEPAPEPPPPAEPPATDQQAAGDETPSPPGAPPEPDEQAAPPPPPPSPTPTEATPGPSPQERASPSDTPPLADDTPPDDPVGRWAAVAGALILVDLVALTVVARRT